MSNIELAEINKSNYEVVLKISAHENQKPFVMPIEKALNLAKVNKNNVYPFAICSDNIVGFIMVRYNKEYNNFFIWDIVIDKNHQNKGYGKSAVLKIIEWIKAKNITKEITTTVIKGNIVSEKLFRDIGFSEMDSDWDDEIDLIYRL